jgi:hypothetical protein
MAFLDGWRWRPEVEDDGWSLGSDRTVSPDRLLTERIGERVVGSPRAFEVLS